MMVQFTEQAYNWDECLDKIRTTYGDNYTILSRKAIRMGGIFGLFTREGVEVTGYVSGRSEKSSSVFPLIQDLNHSGSSTVLPQPPSGPVTGSSGALSRDVGRGPASPR
jgi:flagellar biosynthesis GTPase FlhF